MSYNFTLKYDSMHLYVKYSHVKDQIVRIANIRVIELLMYQRTLKVQLFLLLVTRAWISVIKDLQL